ncbi:MAG: S9 family peptidase [Tepidiformaceae bacterium]
MTRPFEHITLAQVAQQPRPGTVVPAALSFTPDGKGITYLFSEEGSLVRSLWRYDIATGERRVLAGPTATSTAEGQLSREEELRRERARQRELGVTSYQWAKSVEPSVLLVPGGGRLSVSIGGKPLVELQGIEGAIDPRLSSDGVSVAYVRDGELFSAPTSGGDPRQLTSGAEDGLTNGLAEFVAQEELDRAHGFWWNPAGRHIAYVRSDSRHIVDYPIVHQGKDGVEIEHHRYPFAGEANTLVQLGVVELSSGQTTWMDLGPETDIYLARVAWRPDGVLTAQLLSRDQKTLRFIAFDPKNGASTTLIEEHSDPWLNLSDDTRFLKSGEILRSSERTGFNHLYLHAADGTEIRALTSGDWVVTHLAGLDETRRIAYFVATKESVLERHLHAVSLDGGDVTRITTIAGWHGCVLSKDCDQFIDVWSTMERAPRLELRNIDDSLVATLFENAEATSDFLGLRPPAFVTLPAVDGTLLHGAIYAPPNPEPGKRYPVIVSVYGGPHAQRVANEWSMTIDLRAQYLAQEGFIVFKLDNRGSANRGLAFEAALADRMGTVEVDDQVAGVRWLAKNLPIADTSRVGMFGWSYGGYMTCISLMRAPETFKVGVAGAPVTDWDGYDTGYTERYMGTPQSNPEGYFDSSVLNHVEQLRGKLLIVHGMVDENVQFRHTARLIVALTKAQKDYDLLLFPEERHMPRDAKGMEYQERRVFQYFKDNL